MRCVSRQLQWHVLSATMVWGRPRDSGEGFQNKVIARLRLNAVSGISQPIDFCPSLSGFLHTPGPFHIWAEKRWLGTVPLRGHFTGGRRAQGTPSPVRSWFHHSFPSPPESKAAESHSWDQRVGPGLLSNPWPSTPHALEKQGNLTDFPLFEHRLIWPPYGHHVATCASCSQSGRMWPLTRQSHVSRGGQMSLFLFRPWLEEADWDEEASHLLGQHRDLGCLCPLPQLWLWVLTTPYSTLQFTSLLLSCRLKSWGFWEPEVKKITQWVGGNLAWNPAFALVHAECTAVSRTRGRML